MIIKCSELLLNLLKRNNPEQLAKSSKEGPTVLGNVLIHPTAKIDPSAKVNYYIPTLISTARTKR